MYSARLSADQQLGLRRLPREAAAMPEQPSGSRHGAAASRRAVPKPPVVAKQGGAVLRAPGPGALVRVAQPVPRPAAEARARGEGRAPSPA